MPRNQQSLFDAEPEAWEVDAAELHTVASVVLPTGPKGPFDYLVPASLADPQDAERFVEQGRRVRVPFGRGDRAVTGYCVEVGVKRVDAQRLKSIAGVVDSRALLSAAMLRLTQWMADYYLCPWGQVLEAVVPAGVRGMAGTREVKFLTAVPDALAKFATLKLRSPQQRKALEALATSERPLTAPELAESADCSLAPIKSLIKHGLIEAVSARVATNRDAAEVFQRELPLELNSDQAAALGTIKSALDSGKAAGIVLHGVTGSGKTEVYLQAIEHVASFRRQAIVLVPEISLTPQTVRRFRARFDRVAVLHSHLTDAERHQHWQSIARGEVEVIVGARSAVFAPAPHLGLIVIDEEHETTFKQDQAPRYHARDVAWQRAQAEQIPLVLGSATPSLEAWVRAQRGEFEKISLPKRVMNLPLPDVMTIDMRDPAQTRFGKGAITRPLHQAMVEALRGGGQVILLLNRRGFSTHIQCPACGFVLKCEHCDLALTYHRQHHTALCHYCDHEAPPPRACPDCKSPAIRYGGVGTQMIAKGLDFPNVTLVGVINADTALHLPDFRASERTFQLVAQVAGRTGRGKKGGRVLVQTLNPEHPAIMAAVRHDYPRFADHELATRRAAHYPPFASMIRLIVRGAAEATARETANSLGERLRGAVASIGAKGPRVVGPGTAPIARLRGEFRFHLQIQGPEGAVLRQVVREAAQGFTAPEGVRWIADVDPWDMQ